MRMKVLENGLRVVLVPLLGMKSVTAQLFCEIGAKYESKEEKGLSHFLEHMAFKGTPKRPTASAINREIDGKGASYNAETGLEATSYYVTTVRENCRWAVEILADVVLNPLLETGEVKKERQVIAEEIRMYNDNPMMGLSGEFAKLMYGKSKIGCWDVSGDVSNIMAYDRDNLFKYRAKYLNLERTVLVIAGDLGRGDEGAGLFEVAREAFNDWKGKGVRLPKVMLKIAKEKRVNRTRKVEQGHFVAGLQTVPWADKKSFYGIRLLEIIMNGNSSSRLFQKIREDKGWAYYVTGVGENLRESGFWAVQSGVTADKLEAAIDLVRNEVGELANTLTSDELVRAKEFLIGKTKLAADRSSFWTGLVGSKMLLENTLVDLDSELVCYKSVSIDLLKDLATRYFVKKNLLVLAVSR